MIIVVVLDTYIKNHEHIYQIKGKEIKFNSDRRFCSKCNSLVYEEKLDNTASEKGIEIYINYMEYQKKK